MVDSKRVVYACDIGSTKTKPPHFGWVRIYADNQDKVEGSTSIDSLVKCLKEDMYVGNSIALGFESPLFLPFPALSSDLSKGRKGEGFHSVFAPPGAAVTTLGIHQSGWILNQLQMFIDKYVLTFDFQLWSPKPDDKILLIWEAFVVGDAHSNEKDEHIIDAATAANDFLENEKELFNNNAITVDNSFSVIGAAALRTGWTKDINVLKSRTLVIKPKKQHKKQIDIFS